MINIAIYIKVSTEDQAKEGYNPGAYCEKISLSSSEGSIFSSRATDTLATGEQEDAREKKFEVILVHKLDRFSRNLKDLLNLVDELNYPFQVEPKMYS